MALVLKEHMTIRKHVLMIHRSKQNISTDDKLKSGAQLIYTLEQSEAVRKGWL